MCARGSRTKCSGANERTGSMSRARLSAGGGEEVEPGRLQFSRGLLAAKAVGRASKGFGSKIRALALAEHGREAADVELLS